MRYCCNYCCLSLLLLLLVTVVVCVIVFVVLLLLFSHYSRSLVQNLARGHGKPGHGPVLAVLFCNRCCCWIGNARSSCDATEIHRVTSSIARCGGKDFDGCLVFDEAHKAKNFNSAKEENSTKVSQAVIKIQVMIPQAPSSLVLV